MAKAISYSFVSLRPWNLAVKGSLVFLSTPLLSAELEASHEPAFSCHFSSLCLSAHFPKSSAIGCWLTHLGFTYLWRQYNHRPSFAEHTLIWRFVCKKLSRESLLGHAGSRMRQVNSGSFSTRPHSKEALKPECALEFCWKEAGGSGGRVFGHWTVSVPREDGWSWGRRLSSNDKLPWLLPAASTEHLENDSWRKVQQNAVEHQALKMTEGDPLHVLQALFLGYFIQCLQWPCKGGIVFIILILFHCDKNTEHEIYPHNKF